MTQPLTAPGGVYWQAVLFASVYPTVSPEIQLSTSPGPSRAVVVEATPSTPWSSPTNVGLTVFPQLLMRAIPVVYTGVTASVTPAVGASYQTVYTLSVTPDVPMSVVGVATSLYKSNSIARAASW